MKFLCSPLFAGEVVMKLTMKKPFDLHVHFREDEMMRLVVPATSKYFYRALVMPNLKPPILTKEDAVRYREKIMLAKPPEDVFEPLMTIKIREDTDPRQIKKDNPRKFVSPVVAGKVYPKGLTTHADDGVENFQALNPVFAAMEEAGLVLCLHGEMPGKNILGRDRERAFLRTLKFIAKTFPGLKIVMEHITTAAAVDTILDLPENVAATITVHHLLLTQDDVGGDRCCPDYFCKPVAKDPADRAVLRQAATSGCPKFFFGSDSAPHPREGKLRGTDCCAGIFTAPVALPLLAQLFEVLGALNCLEGFVRTHGGRFYEIAEPASAPAPNITLIKESWRVPEFYEGIANFLAGQTLSWRVEV